LGQEKKETSPDLSEGGGRFSLTRQETLRKDRRVESSKVPTGKQNRTTTIRPNHKVVTENLIIQRERSKLLNEGDCSLEEKPHPMIRNLESVARTQTGPPKQKHICILCGLSRD